VKKLGLGILLALSLPAGRAHAEVPAGYTGTPFGGTPRPLPGRIDFEDFDDGGQGVGWSVDDHTGNFGEDGCAANAYRDGIHPQLCKTNTSPGELDAYSTGPLIGQKYPSDAMPVSIYIGYTHAVDWVKLTVNVSEAGTYKLSSSFASEPGGADGIKVQVSFNDVLKADATLAGTGGYHNWADYPDFATVELEAGVQVLQFAAKSMHVNYDYLQLSRVLPGGGVDDGSAGGSAGSGAGGSAGSAGSVGASGAAGSGGSGGTAGEPAAAAGSGGATATAGAAGSAGSEAAPTTTPGAAPTTSDEAAGCACRIAAPQGVRAPLVALSVAALFGVAWRRKRRR
jgi:hypothetical protein